MSMPELEITWDPNKARSNRAKHGVGFGDAATVLLDPLAMTVFDAAHSDAEDRWFTLGRTRHGSLLAVAHTYQVTGPDHARVRIISARPATSRERAQYEQATP